MDPISRIQEFEHIKILSDQRRLRILRLLMARQATLSQLGGQLNMHPAQVRHHLKLLERAGLVEMVDTRVVRGFVEKYYRARARAFLLQEVILPASRKGVPTVVILGSHDLALEALAEPLSQLEESPTELLILPIGSLEGLIALRQGSAQMAGCHLLDAESGEYNLPYVRHLFPDREVTLITLAHREQGLIVPPGNPLGIRDLNDLARGDVRMINRNKGSGTRLWLDRQLALLSLPVEGLRGHKAETRTHTGVAEAVRNGGADVGLGLRAAARQAGMDFIPLFQERFDLVMPLEQLQTERLKPLLDQLQSAKFRKLVRGLGGYDATHTGAQISLA